ncbi:hypothetical protein SAMN05720764_1304 [Fibrobacter sp. UWH5]|nr:hypothetical protein SAMN05720764_1304 [Fibrobacter sp. UWH5]
MSKRIVYVLCPANMKSGGVDALHQLVFYLNYININSAIVYIKNNFDKKNIAVLDRYKPYVQNFLVEDDIIDSSENAVVITESFTKVRCKFKNAKIFIWWLGINQNLTYTFWKKLCFFMTIPLRMIKNWDYYKNNVLSVISNVLDKEIYPFNEESPLITHMCASFHAYDYVLQKSKNEVVLCIEPISKLFLEHYFLEKNSVQKSNRENVVLYNPSRNYNDVIKLLSETDATLKFVPLQGYNQQQLIEKYKTSKLYIDFGAFPGAERIPKEAVLFGCAVITGRLGSSNYYGDVPIPDEYKFKNPKASINDIIVKIHHIFDNFEYVYSDFDEYRNTVLNLEENFVKSLKKIFVE